MSGSAYERSGEELSGHVRGKRKEFEGQVEWKVKARILRSSDIKGKQRIFKVR